MTDELVRRLRRACAAFGIHEHDGCSCSDMELLARRIVELERWNQQMVEKAADGGTLDGYRGLGQRAAKADARAEAAERDAIERRLREPDEAMVEALALTIAGMNGSKYWRAYAGDGRAAILALASVLFPPARRESDG